MFGEDKEEALKHINDDNAFDAWLKRYSTKMSTSHKTHHTKGTTVTKDEYFARMKGTLPQPKKRNGNQSS